MTFEMIVNSGLDLGKLYFLFASNIQYVPTGCPKKYLSLNNHQNLIWGPIFKFLIGQVDQDQIVFRPVADLVILLQIRKITSV